MFRSVSFGRTIAPPEADPRRSPLGTALYDPPMLGQHASTVPVFVINLDRDTQRLEETASNLASLGIAFERIPAVLGADIENQDEVVDRRAYRGRNRRGFPKPGEIGCHLSHLRAYVRLLESGAPWGVVLEDDIVLPPEMPELLRALGERDDWDLVKLFCFHGGTPVRVRRLSAKHGLCVHLTRTTSTAAYAVTRRAAETFLRELQPMTEQIDHAIDRPWKTGLRVRGIRPTPVTLAPSAHTSAIGYQHRKDRRKREPRTPNAALAWWRTTSEVSRVAHGIAAALFSIAVPRTAPHAPSRTSST
jgi:glycosyl transferase family 25